MPRNEEHRQQYYPYQSFSQVSPSPRDTASPWITSFAAPPRPPEPLSPSTYPGSAGQILPSPTSGLYLTSPTSSKLPVEPSHSPPQHATSFVTNIARTTHLQDLQHEVSKKTLALTTLRKEHEALLAAYGRQQTRCTTLEKKTRVSDNEINDLTEERIRLQTQVEMLESQVEDLIRVREEAHKQSVANSAQYMQIMTMSSKLQAQGAEEARMWKLEREQWEKEKSVFIKKIADLESKAVSGDAIRDTGGISRIGLDYTNVEVPPSSPPADLSTSVTCTSTDPLGLLQFENADLKRTIETLEAKIQQMSTEAEEIDRAMNSMMRIRRRLTDITEPCASHADSTLQLAGASVSLENRDVP
ncbi:putative spx domain-containing protein [Phaeomoniella chlamydospora]|uniref:Putative spx domain-containing protein n=1 Tax=Phaeomoniella chlamydospora TaxID=158046 RepID=A0A0G2G3J9_PHACM|nr:putative spx domain-containing protein [Phaeomoniella chlamydospora]